MKRLLAVVVLASCTSPPAPIVDDAGVDASLVDAGLEAGLDANLPAPVPFMIALDDPSTRYRFELDTDPLGFRLLDASGAPVVTNAGLGLAVGLASRGDMQFHEPMQDVPSGVAWSALTTGVSRTSATEGVVRDAMGNTATVSLSSEGAGELTLHVVMSDAAAPTTALMRFVLATDDGHYDGLGERFEGADAHGHRVPMQLSVTTRTRPSGTNEAHVPIPFLVSSHAYGVFAETREAGAFDVGATVAGEMRASFEGHVLDLHFYFGAQPADVIAAYTRHAGLPILAPRWASAPMHWRNEWTDTAQLEGDMAMIRSLDIPCTAFWIDNPWERSYNDHVFDTNRFADPQAMLAEMRHQGFRTLVWTTPYLEAPVAGTMPDGAQVLYAQALSQGYLVTVPPSHAPLLAPSSSGCCAPGGLMDFTSAGAIAFWQQQLDPIIGLGVRAFKLDYGEDVVVALTPNRPNWAFSNGETNRGMHNVYATAYHTPYRNALDHGSTEGGFLLARAEAWGGETITDVIWPGDLDSDMSATTDTSATTMAHVGGMQASISGLISLAASGFPAFASDIGGFRNNPATTDGLPTRETLLRWAEHSAFSPYMQLGGGGVSHDPWMYDAAAATIYAGLARAHMDLVPYYRMLEIAAHTSGAPPVLHPAMAYPSDRAGYTDPNAYLIGSDLFVAPVVTPGDTTRALHLPPGRWVHWSSAMEMTGDVTVAAPIGTPPVFLRVGAIVPMLPPDLDTLAEQDVMPPIVRPSDRPYLRARVLPGGDRSITTEEGLAIHVVHTAAPLAITVTPSAGGLSDLRMQIDLDHSEPPIDPATIATLSANGASVSAAPDAATVQAGCAGVCWFVAGSTLWISVQSSSATTITTP
jgi:alpha-D-xyloside xylohydrolase